MNTIHRDYVPWRWWDEPIISLGEYMYFEGNRWWDDDSISPQEYYNLERYKRKIMSPFMDDNLFVKLMSRKH